MGAGPLLIGGGRMAIKSTFKAAANRAGARLVSGGKIATRQGDNRTAPGRDERPPPGGPVAVDPAAPVVVPAVILWDDPVGTAADAKPEK